MEKKEGIKRRGERAGKNSKSCKADHLSVGSCREKSGKKNERKPKRGLQKNPSLDITRSNITWNNAPCQGGRSRKERKAKTTRKKSSLASGGRPAGKGTARKRKDRDVASLGQNVAGQKKARGDRKSYAGKKEDGKDLPTIACESGWRTEWIRTRHPL